MLSSKSVPFVLWILYSVVASARVVQRREGSAFHSPVSRQTGGSAPYHIYPAVHIQSHEVRSVGSSHPVSDYVMHGLSNIIQTTTNQYGLRNSESFYWGQNGNPLANLTAYVDQEEVKVLSMERFTDVLQTAKCSEGSIEFTFTKEVEFDEVQRAWGWVNDADQNYIVLITENAQCNIADGDPTDRQPWHITAAQFDDNTNVVTLTAESKTWAEAFSDWRLRIASRGIVTSGPYIRSLDKRVTVDQDVTIPLAADFSGAKLTLGDADGNAAAAITCDPCSTTGSLDFDIDVTPYLIPPKLTGTISVIAAGIGATITADTSVTARLSEGASGTATIWEYPFEGIGIHISGVCDIGPALKVNAVGEIGAMKDTVDLKTGVQITIPDNSVYKVDFDDSSQNEDVGWTPVFTPITPEISASLSVTYKVGTALVLELEGEILSIGAAVGIELVAPLLTVEATGIVSATEDACDIAGADYGVELDVSLGADLDAFAQASALGFTIGGTDTIAATSYEFYSTCVQVTGIAPAAAGASTTPASSSSSTLPSSSGVVYTNSSTASSSSSTSYSSSSAAVTPAAASSSNSASDWGTSSSAATSSSVAASTPAVTSSVAASSASSYVVESTSTLVTVTYVVSSSSTAG